MSKTYAFPASRRLRSRSDFSAVFDRGLKFKSGPLIAMTLPNGLEHSRLGIVIGRTVGTAARRNRIKRLLRESFRLMQHEMPGGYDVAVIVRTHEPMGLAAYRLQLSTLITDMHQAWEKRKADSRPKE